MRGRVLLIGVLLVVAGVGGAALLGRERMARCAPVPLIAGELLPNAGLAPSADAPQIPDGWSVGAAGAQLRGPAVDGQGFETDGDGRALQLLGIGNYVETPPAAVSPGTSYCFAGRALTDSEKGSTTRLRLTFRWLDASGAALAEDSADWQPIVLWRPDSPPRDWTSLAAAFQAPEGAAQLRVRIQPSSDDRVYLDAMHLQRTTDDRPPTTGQPQAVVDRPSSVVLQPWPNGTRAAVSFSFDWETAMGGLIHSRSVDDPNSDQDPILRGLRMREGVTTTLDIFTPLEIRATYYANGYNFLSGNVDRQQFMGNPTFRWATPENGWSEAWTSAPWFYRDPHGTYQTDPAWYFGDLVPRLRDAGQDIQSHTFSHFHGRFADAAAWRADLQTWQEVAAPLGVPSARSLAFPWSSSAGLSDADWEALAAAGITSVTRTNWTQPQYRLVDRDSPHCRPVPGHEAILACPDFYLTPRSVEGAKAQIDRAIELGGMIDLWAHTEEVTSDDQIAAWRDVVGYAAARRAAGELWIAPLAEIAAWQQALAQVTVLETGPGRRETGEGGQPALSFSVTNGSGRELSGLTLGLPFEPKEVRVGGEILRPAPRSPNTIRLDLAADETVEVTAWPA